MSEARPVFWDTRRARHVRHIKRHMCLVKTDASCLDKTHALKRSCQRHSRDTYVVSRHEETHVFCRDMKRQGTGRDTWQHLKQNLCSETHVDVFCQDMKRQDTWRETWQCLSKTWNKTVLKSLVELTHEETHVLTGDTRQCLKQDLCLKHVSCFMFWLAAGNKEICLFMRLAHNVGQDTYEETHGNT